MNQKTLTSWLSLAHGSPSKKMVDAELEYFQTDADAFLQNIAVKFDTFPSVSHSLISQTEKWLDDSEDHHIITYCDPLYPQQLKAIHSPPILLYLKGDPECLLKPQIAIVGSRYPSTSGIELTDYFTKALVEADLIITSGMAIGIDGASHFAALEAGGKTIAVLGSGLKNIYPKKNQRLAEHISKQGCLVSEFPISDPPMKRNFPMRNRIISGLSLGTLVIEAKQRSGSLITAQLAAEQGREVFAVPGSIQHALSDGCHELIKTGAVLTQCAEDIFETFNIALSTKTFHEFKQSKPNHRPGLDPAQQQLLALVDYEGSSTDDIIRRSGLTASEVASRLLNLELSGYIRPVPWGYSRVL